MKIGAGDDRLSRRGGQFHPTRSAGADPDHAARVAVAASRPIAKSPSADPTFGQAPLSRARPWRTETFRSATWRLAEAAALGAMSILTHR